MLVSLAITMAGVIFKLAAGLGIADFVSGIVHWWEDRYGNPDWPVIGHTIRMNQEHHINPRFFLCGNIWTRNREVFGIGIVFLGLFWALGWLNLVTVSAVLFGVWANEIHACAHRSPKENSRWVGLIQKTGLMQSHKHHAAHHRRAKNTNYCVMTNYVNPVLEFIRFFRAAEWLIKRVSGIVPRPDPSVNPRYL